MRLYTSLDEAIADITHMADERERRAAMARTKIATALALNSEAIGLRDAAALLREATFVTPEAWARFVDRAHKDAK